MWDAGEMVSSLRLLGITLLTVTRGDETHEDPEIILVGFRKGQTSRPKSPIADCGVLSAISNERLGNAQLSQGLSGLYKGGGQVGGVGWANPG